jgi:hypothetical protein
MPDWSFTVIVGTQPSTDETLAVAESFPCQVLQSEVTGKFHNLTSLVEKAPSSEGDSWIALVDCGALWRNDLLNCLKPYFTRSDLFSIAPSYRHGYFSFTLERLAKSLENYFGGPISVHGATAFYRSTQLKFIFTYLHAILPSAQYQGMGYLNDDVVIPLCGRVLFPEQKILYLSQVFVEEAPLAKEQTTFKKRVRMVCGNLQWILLRFWRNDFTIVLLASRRILRLFWAYWALLLFLIAISLSVSKVTTIMALFGSIFLIQHRGFRYSFFASLLALPLLILLLLRRDLSKDVSWN